MFNNPSKHLKLSDPYNKPYKFNNNNLLPTLKEIPELNTSLLKENKLNTKMLKK